MAESIIRNDHKARRGYVVNDKMGRTVVAQIEDCVKHALHDKVTRKSKKVKVYDEHNEYGVGGPALIVETRLLSATKHWHVIEIIEKAK